MSLRICPAPITTDVSGFPATAWATRFPRADACRDCGADDAAVVDVGAELGRDALERIADGLDDLAQRVGERLADFLVADRHGAGDAFRDVAALDFHLDGLSSGMAEPSSILICSAVRSPTCRP